MIYILITIITIKVVTGFFLGFLPSMFGIQGKVTVEGHLPGVLAVAWTAFNIWFLLELWGAQ